MRTIRGAAGLAGLLGALSMPLHAQESQLTLRDLEGKSPKKLSKEELAALMTGAKMSRVSGRGNAHRWTNETDGSFIISSDNRGAGGAGSTGGRPSTAPGKWHISDDGRYCIFIDWRGVPAEEWCRFIIQTSEGYYGVRSDTVGSERVYKLEVAR